MANKSINVKVPKEIEKALQSAVRIKFPEHVEIGETNKLILEIKNFSKFNFESITIDLSDLVRFFDIVPEHTFTPVRSGDEIQKSVLLITNDEFSADKLKVTFIVNISSLSYEDRIRTKIEKSYRECTIG